MAQEFRGCTFADTMQLFDLCSDGGLAPFLTVKCDGKPVRLVPDLLKKKKAG